MSEKGLISDDMVRDHGNVVLTILSSPGGREFWNTAGTTFLKRSAAYINEHLDSGADWGSMTQLFPYFLEHEVPEG